MDENDNFLSDLIKAEFENKNWKEICMKLEMQIYQLEEYMKYFHDLIPLKYKKFDPKKGENPFFSYSKFTLPNDAKEYEEAKKRMEEFLKNGTRK